MITQARIDAEIAPRARLDHGVAGAGDPGACGRRSPADVAVRRPRHGGHHVARLSGRAAHRLSQSDLAASALASARTCWPRPRRTSPSRSAVRRARKPLRGEARLRSRSAPSSTGARWPSTSTSSSARSFAFHRKAAAIAAEAALDGIYVVRTSLPSARTPLVALTKASPGRARVPLLEPSTSICVRSSTDGAARARPRLPVHARLSRRASHARPLAPMLYDETVTGRRRVRTSIVAKAERSAAASATAPAAPTTVSRCTLPQPLADLATTPPGDHRAHGILFPPHQPPRSRAAPSNSSPSPDRTQ